MKRFLLLASVLTLVLVSCEKDEEVTPLPADCIDPAMVDRTAACTEEYNPVCGCNDVTYDNPCYARMAGVLSFQPGPCSGWCGVLPDPECIDSSRIDSTALCPHVYDPVCGCDGVTYSNECSANVRGVMYYSPGPCPNQPPGHSCIDSTQISYLVLCAANYEPVCGCDGVTYPNKCIAQFNHGVTQWTLGPCPNKQ